MLCLSIFCALAGQGKTQVCSDPAHVIYGLTDQGYIRPVHVSNATVDSALNPPPTGLSNPPFSNAIGYNPVNSNFYYYMVEDQTPIQFASFNSTTNVTTTLTPLPGYTDVVSACINAGGTFLYCLNGGNNLCYYSIATDSWTTLTSDFVNQNGQDVTANFQSMASGDMAMDGSGNLWMVIASSTTYALYLISAANLPSTNVASVPVFEIIPPTSSPLPGGTNFNGIAFDPTGQIYLSTQTDLYLLESDLSTIDHIGTFDLASSEQMYDLTSCNFPQVVLPVSWLNFTATLQSDGNVLLDWQYGQPLNEGTYSIQRSGDGQHWVAIGTEEAGPSVSYSFEDTHPLTGKDYYRILLQTPNIPATYTGIRLIDLANPGSFAIWPNPVKSSLFIQNTGWGPHANLQLYDASGRAVTGTMLSPGTNILSMSNLASGVYIAEIRGLNGTVYTQKVMKE